MKLYKVTLRGFGRTAEFVLAKDHKAAHCTISKWLSEQGLGEHELKCIELIADSDQSSEVSDGWQDISHLHLPQSNSDEVDNLTVSPTHRKTLRRLVDDLKVRWEASGGDDHAEGDDYPERICFACGSEYGAEDHRLARRWHEYATIGTCGICGEMGLSADPADFGHLKDDSWRPLYGDPAVFKAKGPE